MEDIVGVGIGPFLWYSTPHPWEGFSSAVYHFSVCILSVILVLEVDRYGGLMKWNIKKSFMKMKYDFYSQHHFARCLLLCCGNRNKH